MVRLGCASKPKWEEEEAEEEALEEVMMRSKALTTGQHESCLFGQLKVLAISGQLTNILTPNDDDHHQQHQQHQQQQQRPRNPLETG